MPSNSTDSFSPEMIRILKIFGIGSILFVFVLSFFNEKRADNSGEFDSVLRVPDSNRIYFKNLRAPQYDREGRDDAKMNLYRHGKRTKSDQAHFNFMILLNRVKDEAYIFVEPFPDGFPIVIRHRHQETGEGGEITFYGGDKMAHYEFALEFYPLAIENTYFEIKSEEDWIPLLDNEKEREALRVTLVDFFRLIDNPK